MRISISVDSSRYYCIIKLLDFDRLISFLKSEIRYLFVYLNVICSSFLWFVYIFLLDCEPFSCQCLGVLIIRDIFFLLWVVSIFPLVYHLSFGKYVFLILESYKSLLLLATIHLGTVLMNLSRSVILLSPFWSKLHETPGLQKAFLWSFWKYSLLTV